MARAGIPRHSLSAVAASVGFALPGLAAFAAFARWPFTRLVHVAGCLALAAQRPGPYHRRMPEPQSEPTAAATSPSATNAEPLPSQRLSDVLDAVVALGTDLHLSAVLSRIVSSASQLTGARYGALGVLHPSGQTLSEFVTYGITDQERRELGPPPVGHGLLGVLIREPHPLRLGDISAHPESSGVPSGHPDMRSFLGAPITLHDDVFGNLYLTEKQGAAEFTAVDEQVVVALATAAGVAIENARLYEQSQDQQRLAAVAADITRTLLGGNEDGRSAQLIADRAAELVDATVTAVALRDDDGRLRLRGFSGPTGLSAPCAVGDPVDEPVDPRALTAAAPDAPALDLPMALNGEVVGVLAAAWEPGSALAVRARPLLEDFARQSALALQAERWRRDRDRLRTLEDRERIARDMHDHVIQRLFATGLSLQAAERADAPVGVRARIDEAIGELDASVKDIRQSIFALRQGDGEDLPATLSEVVRQSATTMGFRPVLTLGSDVSLLEPDLGVDVLAVVREGLANVGRHADAQHAWVTVSAGSRVAVEISDDGLGMPSTPRRSGLTNLAHRAEHRGGSLTVSPRAAGGTTLDWSVPRGGFPAAVGTC